MEKKRKGYSKIEMQLEANKRYLENNPDAKIKNRINSLRSSCKRFIKEFAELDELEELQALIQDRKKELA